MGPTKVNLFQEISLSAFPQEHITPCAEEYSHTFYRSQVAEARKSSSGNTKHCL